MTGAECGFLLLTSQLGDPERRPLTAAQFRMLAQRSRGMESVAEQRELCQSDLTALGYGREMAERILMLLSETELLEYYLRRGKRCGCVSVTWASADYPSVLRDRLGDEAPGCLWARGDLSLLREPMVSLVGSRDIQPLNRNFAREVGRQAARQGFTLVSGNARGSDRAAQQDCLEAGGHVICVVADELERTVPQENILYLSEDVFDGAFSTQRALSRNRVIHCLGSRVFVAQCGCQRGGTWDGTCRNLRQQWSDVFCFMDGSEGVQLLLQLGAQGIKLDDLHNINNLLSQNLSLFD